MSETMTRRARVNTTLFERSHNKAPKGRGSWIFSIGNGDTVIVFGTFAAASRQALTLAREASRVDGRAREVFVLP